MQATDLLQARVNERLLKRTPGSAKLFMEAKRTGPGGVMAGIKAFEPYPIFMKRAQGSLIWDVDENEYVDYLLSFGALILGHGTQSTKGAVTNLFGTIGTTVTGTPTRIEVEYARMLLDIYNTMAC